jgi:hypothetical protein
MKALVTCKQDARYLWKQSLYIRPNGFTLVELLVFVQWHYARGPSDVPLDQLDQDRQPFISPVLFVDGRVARHDFTRTIQADPVYCFEPTKDWIWYKPVEPAQLAQ